MLRILITGAGSFIGRNFIKYSKNKNVEEVSLMGRKPEQIDFKKYDIVIHLAAYVHQSRSVNEDEYFRINRDLSLEVAKCAKKQGIKQFLFMSTVKVYGDTDSSDWSRSE